jgi:non-specific serine/threonine protein kinase/serine/threonine-protein kinase
VSSRHELLHEIFTKAIGLVDGERTAFMNDACHDDRALRTEVESMLAADAMDAPVFDGTRTNGGAKFLAGALAADGELDPLPVEVPERIGNYRILGVLGEGGMGLVYEAEQDEPKRRVALKVVRRSMVTRELLQRFRQEAQVLGHLQHPGIAKVYEAGTADDGEGGRPFFAMELVEGLPITKYADDHHLDTPARLKLIALLCDAVHHAHQKGVIHRDLKPANILVTAPGGGGSSSPPPRPKILDFGVARATDADLQTVTLHTTAGQLIGTVRYMSPEQAGGDPADIDIRSDVYALGVIAYELLTGRLPYDVSDKIVYEAVRIIRESAPSSISEIDRSLRGDVQTILTKALEKDKERRYQSAADLASDIRRHLRHEPIHPSRQRFAAGSRLSVRPAQRHRRRADGHPPAPRRR